MWRRYSTPDIGSCMNSLMKSFRLSTITHEFFTCINSIGTSAMAGRKWSFGGNLTRKCILRKSSPRKEKLAQWVATIMSSFALSPAIIGEGRWILWGSHFPCLFPMFSYVKMMTALQLRYRYTVQRDMWLKYITVNCPLWCRFFHDVFTSHDKCACRCPETGTRLTAADSGRVSINPSGTTLTIGLISSLDAGVYECVAENLGGRRTASARLSVISQSQYL